MCRWLSSGSHKQRGSYGLAVAGKDDTLKMRCLSSIRRPATVQNYSQFVCTASYRMLVYVGDEDALPGA